jgi:GNAT superfamily N-acetyltransferase
VGSEQIAVIRPFTELDYDALLEIGARVHPEAPPNREAVLFRDGIRKPEHRLVRLVYERDGQVVAWGQVGHMWWAFHPRRYALRLEVDPAMRQQGIGSALHDQLLGELREWDAELVRSEARESEPLSVEFANRRGYEQIMRRLDLRLPVAHANLHAYGDLERHLQQEQGITISSVPEVEAMRGAPLAREVYELDVVGSEDEPRPDDDTVMSFEDFVQRELGDPFALPDAQFVALDGERLVGMSRLSRFSPVPGVLDQGFTTVLPGYRGRGIAQALKVRTVQYAQVHGYHEIRTGVMDSNAPMLQINHALGFRDHPAVLIMEHRL